MNKIFVVSLLLFGAIIVSSCEKNSGALTSDINIDGPILFSKIYVNYAWGYQYSGWYIDLEGQIYEFNENLEPKLDIAHNSSISKEILSESLQSATKTDKYLDQPILTEMIKLIKKVYKGSVSDPENVCADFGSLSYFTFIRDQEGDTCRSILLYQVGDWAQKNLESEATELFELLRKHVDDDTGQLPCSPK